MTALWKFDIFLWLVVLILFILSTFFIVQIRGWIGENAVRRRIRKLPQEDYRVINNVLLPYKNGTTQIDHVVVSKYGIFVLETKYMKGKIYGNEKGHDWQKYSHGRCVNFRNPFHQNYGHIMGLKSLCGREQSDFISMVIFVGSPKLKVETKNPLYDENDFVDAILSKRSQVLTEQDVISVENLIRSANVDSVRNRKAHKEAIKKRIAENDKKIEQGICPSCGGNLVARNGKRGPFYGCSNYPKCRYTADIKGL